jgi:hypothetical protein
MITSFMRAIGAAQKHLQVIMLVSIVGAVLVVPAISIAHKVQSLDQVPSFAVLKQLVEAMNQVRPAETEQSVA